VQSGEFSSGAKGYLFRPVPGIPELYICDRKMQVSLFEMTKLVK